MHEEFLSCVSFKLHYSNFQSETFFSLENIYIISMNGSVVGVWNWKYFYGQDEGVQLNFDLSLLDENKGKSLHKFLLICKAAHMQLRNVGNYW